MGSLALAAPGLLLLVAGPALAWVVFAARPDRAQNRRLAVLLAWMGVSIGFYAGVRVAFDSRELAYAAYGVFAPMIFLMPFLYVRFLATLDTPLRRALASPITQAATLAIAAVSGILWYTRRDGFILAFTDELGFYAVDQGPLSHLVFNAVPALIMVVGLVVAILAWRRAATQLARKQAGLYALAFGVRDAFVIAWTTLMVVSGVREVAPLLIALLPVGELIMIALLAYGILKMQLFDIDLKLKWTLSKGTVAAGFVAVFFIVSEGAQSFLSTQLGSVAGLVAAGSLVFALAPLQRAADRLADTAMPRVRHDADYLTVRRREVYQAAVEGVLEDGEITQKERTVLARLQDQLALSASEALAIEREATAARRA